MKPELIKVMRKIKALRSLAKSSNANEAASAAATADRLMQEYRISEAELGVVPVGRDSEPLDIWKQIPAPRWKELLVLHVCNHYDVAFLYNEYEGTIGGRKAMHRHVVMCGGESDLALCRLMYRWVKRQALVLGRKEPQELRAAFRYGLVLAVARALANVKREAIANAPRTAALALRDRLATSRRRMYEENPALQPLGKLEPEPDPFDLMAVRRGFEAGEKLELDKKRAKLNAPKGG